MASRSFSPFCCGRRVARCAPSPPRQPRGFRPAAGLTELLEARGCQVVAPVEDFIEALHRVANGGSALDPELITQLMAPARSRRVLARLTPRELDTLVPMAEGRSNRSNADTFVVGERAVEKFLTSIFQNLDLAPDDTDNPRVRAVLTYLAEADRPLTDAREPEQRARRSRWESAQGLS